jgi:virulence-associated protein VapD
MKKNGFEHRQGSGYISKEAMDDNDTERLNNKIFE